MQDLTKGPIQKHIISMALPIAIGMLIQTLYFIIDLYFVGHIGKTALAGVSTAGNLFFFVMALTQVFNVGCATLIAHAIGRKDKQHANKIYSHTMFYSVLATLLSLVVGYGFSGNYFLATAVDNATYQACIDYFYWFLPSISLQFVLTAIMASMRGAGLVKPFMMMQMFALIINAILSPILITGVGVFTPMGVSGAGLASSIAAIIALLLSMLYLKNNKKTLQLRVADIRSDWPTLKNLLRVGVPAGSEFMLTFLYMAVIYWVLADFGAHEQAGFGLGSRIMQSLFLPVLAIAFAAPAIAGQNYAAGKLKRVYVTYKFTMLITVTLMLLISIPCIVVPHIFFTAFSDDPQVIRAATTFLSFIGFNFVPAGIVFSASAMFQAFGNTWPSLLGTSIRIGSFCCLLFFYLSQQALTISTMWTISVVTVCIQAILVFIMLQVTLKRRVFSKALKRKSDVRLVTNTTVS
ncbi:Multidrug export protein MepA [Pseudoalteromonas sp. CIP111854]|uniref:Multidrug-efflux transporter n=1 Tax=Pseudoalteromonas holothuriae TaxID=2963714 RepID=A0A9W4VNR4_9GAMM|nr:MATE family efflux transporter [Pseudoalteromonas sp. CIP111854]CAH9052323.1 Multidrug export protein MepA [Pseudoalteromonas sp. CIP111854]